MTPANPHEGISDALRAYTESLSTRSLAENIIERVRLNSVAESMNSLNDLNRRISASLGVADAVRHLLPSYGPPRSVFQQMTDNALGNARFHQRMESMATQIVTATAPLSLTRELLRAFEPPRNSIQQIIDRVQVTITRNPVADIFEQARAATRIAQPRLDPISETIQRAVASNEFWQSQRTTDFLARFVREQEFQNAFLSELDAEEQQEAQSPASAIPVQTVLDAVTSGLEEAVGNQSTVSAEAAVQNMFSRWRALPDDLRGLVIGVISGIIATYICFFLLPASGTNNYFSVTVAPQQQVRIVQRTVQTVVINNGFSSDVQRSLRIVNHDHLPVYRANRRDSPRMTILSRAKVVTAISQRRNWTEITWSENEEGELRSGWVYTRYLKKISSR